MGRVYRTAQGKSIDMDSVQLKNETTIAVGNMKVNARGDKIGSGGKIEQGRNAAMDQQYKINSPQAHKNRVHQAQQAQRQAGATVSAGVPPSNIPSVDPSGESFDPVDFEEVAQPQEQTMRGSLADSIAKQVTVTQELLSPRAAKPKRPTRI
jgi:hypothetical protein